MKYDRNKIFKQIHDAELTFQYEIISTREDVSTLLVHFNQKSIFFHSKFAPIKEANKLVRSLSADASVVILAGFGLGYHIEAAVKKNPKAQFLILDNNPGIIKLAMQINPSVKSLLNSTQIFLFFEPEELLYTISQVSTKKINYLFHRPSFELYPTFYSQFKNLLMAALQKKNINMATLSRFQKLWAKNITKNLPFYLLDAGVKEVFNSYKNKPVLLIGAGPSFEESLPFIQKMKNKAVIVAVDSIVNRLLLEKIEPHFIVSVDPQIINYYFFYLFHKINFSSLLVYEPSVNFLIPKQFKNKRITFDSIFPIMKWIEKINGEKGSLDMGGSVSTTAFDFAVKLGGEPIFLIGQDMAFSYNKTHARGSFAEYYLLKLNKKLKPMESLSFKYTNFHLQSKIKSNSGNDVKTDKRLLMFYWWFDKKIRKLKNIKIFNLAKEGAMIEGTTYLSVAESIKMSAQYSDMEYFKYDFGNDEVQVSFLKQKTQEVLRSLLKLEILIQEAISLSEKLYEKIRIKTQDNLQSILKRLDEIDKKIESAKQENEFIGITMQKVIFSIIEDYEDYLNEAEKKNQNLAVAKKSVMLYTELQKSISYNLKLFKDIDAQLSLMKS